MVSQLKDSRVKFHKGEQRKFLRLVAERLNSVSVRGILQFGFDLKYSTLKNYYVERRLLPKGFFEELCHMAKIDSSKLEFKYLEGSWGQRKGGKSEKVKKSKA
jgi:hypothetical protein